MKRRYFSAFVFFLLSSTLACSGAIIHKSSEASILYRLWKSTSLSRSRYNIPTDPVRYLRCQARVFIYFRGVNERDADYCTPPSAIDATSFLRSICRDAIFAPAFIPATYNLINQPSYRSYPDSHPPDSSQELMLRRLSLHQREIPFCIPRG